MSYNNSYDDLPGYYPVQGGASTTKSNVSAAKCKDKCNKSNNCGYYWTYSSNEVPQCVLDTTGGNTPPIYNQIRGDNMDKQSGALSLRNKKFKEDLKPCAMQKSFQPTIFNTEDYTTNFPFARYDISSGSITENDQLGMCGDEEYNKYVARAKDILYAPRLYNTAGEWDHNNTGSFSMQENMATKSNTAVSDSGAVIDANLNNHEILRQKMIGIDSRYRDLSLNIHDYNRMNAYMMKDKKYDQNGNVLLYFKDKPAPTLMQMNSSDSKLLSDQQTILFYTGMITAATLIVLAVTLGSE